MSDIIWHQLPSDLCRLICDYVGNDRLKPWVKEIGLISWYWLSANPSAMDLLKANLNKIDWVWLSWNPSAIELLKANPNKIDKDIIWANPSIFEPKADHFTLLMQIKF